MASGVYEKWKEALLQNSADSDLDQSGATAGVFCALIDTAVYTTPDFVNDEFWDESGANDAVDGLVGTEIELASKTFANGVFDAADITFTSVSGATVEGLAFFRKNAGAQTTWQLVAFLDSGDVTGLPVTPNGGNIDVSWNGSGIFKL